MGKWRCCSSSNRGSIEFLFMPIQDLHNVVTERRGKAGLGRFKRNLLVECEVVEFTDHDSLLEGSQIAPFLSGRTEAVLLCRFLEIHLAVSDVAVEVVARGFVLQEDVAGVDTRVRHPGFLTPPHYNGSARGSSTSTSRVAKREENPSCWSRGGRALKAKSLERTTMCGRYAVSLNICAS